MTDPADKLPFGETVHLSPCVIEQRVQFLDPLRSVTIA